jgi:hypothetical protein
MTAAADLDPEKALAASGAARRDAQHGGRRFTDDDLIEITKLARTGLAREPA